MKVVILAGGLGTRISEESHLKPKPMIEIGEKPILWHIMKHYASFGYDDFLICCGYKAYVIKEYFANYYLHNCDVSFDFRNNNSMKICSNQAEPWRVTLVDTGLNTMTGGRILRVKEYINNESFFLTYGDGVSNVDIRQLHDYHKEHGKTSTITTVNAGQRFGVIDIDKDGSITEFREKSEDDGSMINAGFMVFDPDIFNYIDGDSTILEREPMERLAKNKQLMSYKHTGFWKCMDTQRDKENLEAMWRQGDAPWKVW